MREYMMNLGVVMMLIALANILLPEGGLKKFASLAMGFMLITAALSFLPRDLGEISFSAESFEIDEEEIETARAQYRAEVLKEHRKNLEKKIEENMRHGSKAFVELREDGEILSVTLRLRGDESGAVLYIINTLNVPRERIKLSYDEN